MPDEAPVESSSRGHSWIWWSVWAFLIAFVLYPLSTGPVFRICRECAGGYDAKVLPWRCTEIFYAPLILLTDHCRPLQEFFGWYILLWCPNLI